MAKSHKTSTVQNKSDVQASASNVEATAIPASLANMSEAELASALEARRKANAEAIRATRAADATAIVSTVQEFFSKHGEDGMDILMPELEKIRPARKRVVLTPAQREEVITILKGRTMTAKQIAEKFGISVPTVNNIKDGAGLTQKREGVTLAN
jgi:DNA-binding NarL/FixJ family response regulator